MLRLRTCATLELVDTQPMPTASRGAVFIAVCLSVFHTISQKPMQIGSSNVTYKCSTMSPGNQFILGSNGQRSRSQGQSSDGTQKYTCRVRKLRWVFRVVMPAVQAMLSPVHTSNNVEATFDFVAKNGNNAERVLRWNFVLSTKSNVASTMLLVWTGL